MINVCTYSYLFSIHSGVQYIGSLRICAAVVQLVLVNLMLGASFARKLLAVSVSSLKPNSFQLRRRDWWLTGLFPRVVYCDADIRVLANTQRHTFQSVHTDLSCHASFHESAVKPFVN